MAHEIEFLDQSKAVLATASVEGCGDFYTGRINLGAMPARFRDIFKRYENVVNDHALSLLDGIEDEINALHVVARFGFDVFKVKDLQIFPEAEIVSFKTIREPAPV